MLHIFCFHLFLKMYCTTEFCCLDNFNTQYELLKVWREREKKRVREREKDKPAICLQNGLFCMV